MIADSPFNLRAPVLTVPQSMTAGAIGVLAMLAVLRLLHPFGSADPARVLSAIGGAVALSCADLCGERARLLAGSGALVVLGIIGGVLYGSSQQRIPPPRLLGVGAFFGVLVWLVDRLFLGPLAGGELAALARSWAWLVACVSYGVMLAVAGIWVDVRRPKMSDEIAQPD